jgi:hypothetical protein
MSPAHRARGALPLGVVAAATASLLARGTAAATLTVANPPPLGTTAPFTGVLSGLTAADGAGPFKAR